MCYCNQKIKIYNNKIMNISSMLDYIRNPFASGRVSDVIGKSKFLTRKLRIYQARWVWDHTEAR